MLPPAGARGQASLTVSPATCAWLTTGMSDRIKQKRGQRLACVSPPCGRNLGGHSSLRCGSANEREGEHRHAPLGKKNKRLIFRESKQCAEKLGRGQRSNSRLAL